MTNRRAQGARRRDLRRHDKHRSPARARKQGQAELDLWANEIADVGRENVRAALQAGRTDDNVDALTRAMMANAEELLLDIRRQMDADRTHKTLDCREGCSWCRSLHVACTVPEVLLISRRLQQTLDDEALQAVYERVAAADAQTRGQTTLERSRVPVVCPLLVNNRCSVYAVRPLACRGSNSYDVTACQQAREQPTIDILIPQNKPFLAAAAAVTVGLAEGLQTEGLGPPAIELIAGLRIALETHRAAERWLAGEPVFAAAEM